MKYGFADITVPFQAVFPCSLHKSFRLTSQIPFVVLAVNRKKGLISILEVSFCNVSDIAKASYAGDYPV